VFRLYLSLVYFLVNFVDEGRRMEKVARAAEQKSLQLVLDQTGDVSQGVLENDN
jgi:hypothetical protein